MNALVVLGYHAALIFLAYRVGRSNAGPGIAVFLVGVLGFQIAVNGPASLLEGGCQRYSIHASDC